MKPSDINFLRIILFNNKVKSTISIKPSKMETLEEKVVKLLSSPIYKNEKFTFKEFEESSFLIDYALN